MRERQLGIANSRRMTHWAGMALLGFVLLSIGPVQRACGGYDRSRHRDQQEKLATVSKVHTAGMIVLFSGQNFWKILRTTDKS